MMKYMTKFERNIPVSTSVREARNSAALAPSRAFTVFRPIPASSSTSWEACQKNRYGEIVVPRMPTMVETYSGDHSRCGTRVAFTTSFHGGRTRNAQATYEKRTSVSHRKMRAICR